MAFDSLSDGLIERDALEGLLDSAVDDGIVNCVLEGLWDDEWDRLSEGLWDFTLDRDSDCFLDDWLQGALDITNTEGSFNGAIAINENASDPSWP